MALVTKIKEYREKAGMKQAELAELVNARRETIVHLENGKYNPSLKLAMDIATFFAPRLINAITSFYACAFFTAKNAGLCHGSIIATGKDQMKLTIGNGNCISTMSWSALLHHASPFVCNFVFINSYSFFKSSSSVTSNIGAPSISK